MTTFAGFMFGLITGGINNTGAVWGASDSWPTVEMQSRCVDSFPLLCFVQLKRCHTDENVLTLLPVPSYSMTSIVFAHCEIR